MPRRIGILGGMGPEATVLLMQRLIAAVPAADDSGHIPLIVDQNPQVPSRIAYLIEGRGEDPGPILARMARGLHAAGAEALAMPCNTAHHYADTIAAAVPVPFLDMVALSATQARARAGEGARVGILGSPALRRVDVFGPALERAGLHPVYPSDGDALLASIRSIKAKGANPVARETLAAAAAELEAKGARLQIVACTEFSLITDALQRFQHMDTLDILVSAITEFAFSEEAQP